MEGSVYLKARQEWRERYADLVLGKRNWQVTAAGMMAILHHHGEQRHKTS